MPRGVTKNSGASPHDGACGGGHVTWRCAAHPGRPLAVLVVLAGAGAGAARRGVNRRVRTNHVDLADVTVDAAARRHTPRLRQSLLRCAPCRQVSVHAGAGAADRQGERPLCRGQAAAATAGVQRSL
eukprot:141955-Chlamydomonas_euryale.AAC.1